MRLAKKVAKELNLNFKAFKMDDNYAKSFDEDAEIAVDEMMDIIGLQKNFKLQECPNINNAIAKNIKNSSGNMVRYILYDNDFFSKMDAKAGNDWAAISILAHEIGHYKKKHIIKSIFFSECFNC